METRSNDKSNIQTTFTEHIYIYLYQDSFIHSLGGVGRIRDSYITVSNSPNFPSCLDEAMETRKTSSIA